MLDLYQLIKLNTMYFALTDKERNSYIITVYIYVAWISFIFVSLGPDNIACPHALDSLPFPSPHGAIRDT